MTDGPLTLNRRNPRYFADSHGRAVLWTGFHTWDNLQDMRPGEAPNPFDFDRYLETLSTLGHNHIRLWVYQTLCTWNPADRVDTFPWTRSGPGDAVDGRPKFDLERLDDAYFARLVDRVSRANDRGIYVGVMLFECWATIDITSTPFSWHAFAGTNNINGVDVSAKVENGWMVDWMALGDPAVVRLQELYVERVVRELNRFPNVVYEIANEAGQYSYAWQEHHVRFIRELESTLPHQHLVGVCGGMNTRNDAFFAIDADYLAPEGWMPAGEPAPYCEGRATWGEFPELARGPIILDTDHLWGIGGNARWAWMSFLRGYHVLYMDPVTDFPSTFFTHEWYPGGTDLGFRASLGAIQHLASEIDLNGCIPDNARASSGYALVSSDAFVSLTLDGTALVVQPEPGSYSVEWWNLESGRVGSASPVHVEGSVTLKPPEELAGSDAVVLLRRLP